MIKPIDVIKLIVNPTWKIPSSIFLVCFRVCNVKRKNHFYDLPVICFVRKSQDNVRFILFCEVFLRFSVLSLTIYSFYLGLYLEVIFCDRKYTVYSVELWNGLS